MKKICFRCKKIKQITEFNKHKISQDGFNSTCKECRKDISLNSYYKKYDKNKMKNINENRKEYKALWYQKDKKDNFFKYKKAYTKQNENRKEYKALWYQKNKERLNIKLNEKRRNNLKEKINHNFSNSIRKALIRNKNNYHWENIIGYTLNDLIYHLRKNIQEGCVFEDYLTSNKLHIDHIIPIDFYSFTTYKDEDFKKCWALKNLRLLSAKDNLFKKNKIDKKLIIEYDIKNLLPGGINLNDV